jgi:acyl-coenzyme A synthetase/AMP-(fatty) acid ligase
LLIDDKLDLELLSRFENILGIESRITLHKSDISIFSIGNIKKTKKTNTEWVIPTSGTTGSPKLIAHSFSSLTRSLKSPSKKSSMLRWGLLYNPTRFAGLQVILQAIWGGSGLIVPEHPADLKSSIHMLKVHRCNALSATPSLWRKLAFSGLLEALQLNVITLGGEAADQKTLDTLRKHYPEATIRHIYASTEAGVGFSVADGKAGFPARFFESPPPGIELKIGQDGMLMLRPSLCNQQLLSDEHPLIDENGWISSGDTVEIHDTRCFFLGRVNGAINVGGAKVHPEEIESFIMQTPGVVAVRAFGKPSPVLGALVAVEIIAEDGINQSGLHKQIMERCKKHLDRFKTPALIIFKKEIELSSSGKIKR